MPLALAVRDLRKRYGDVVAVDGLDLEVARAASASACSAPTAPARRPPSRSARDSTAPTRATSRCSAGAGPPTSARCANASASSCRRRSSPRSSPSHETLRLFRSFYRAGPTTSRSSSTWCSSTRSATRASARCPADRSSGSRVACALVGDPELLFLDEPTTGLDPQSRRQLWDLVERVRAAGRTHRCSPRTTWRRPSGCATAWRSSTRAR